MTTTTEVPPRRAFKSADTDELRSELRQLLADRQHLLETVQATATEDILAMMLELTVVRHLTGQQIADAIGRTKQAVTVRLKPYREAKGADPDPLKPRTWDRPFAHVETRALLNRLVKEYPAQAAGPTHHPEVIKLEERIRRYVTELVNRARPGDEDTARGRWTGQTGLKAVAAEVGASRSTLARIMGWDT